MVGTLWFSVKYVFRSLHMLTFAFIFGNACYDFYFGRRFSTLTGSALTFNITSSLVLIISGFINMLLLIFENRYEKTSSYQLWKNLLITKFFLSFLLTPLLEKSLKVVGMNESKASDIRLFLMGVLFLISPFLRFYREYNLVSSKVANKAN